MSKKDETEKFNHMIEFDDPDYNEWDESYLEWRKSYNNEQDRRKNIFDYNEKNIENKCKAYAKIFVHGYYKKDEGIYVQGYCREMNSEEKRNYRKNQIKKTYPLGGGDYIVIYEPINPVEDLVGGKVKFGKSKITKRRR